MNDLVVREQMYNGSMHRYLFLAASAGLKEFAVIEVTNDIPTERVAIDLPGSIDARSITLAGNRVYVGRASGSGPELYQYDVRSLLTGNTIPLATSEVGADTIALRVSGDWLFVGTSKSGEEFQVWHSNPVTWNSSVVQAGRVSSLSIARLAPLGVELAEQYVCTLSHSGTQMEYVKLLTTP